MSSIIAPTGTSTVVGATSAPTSPLPLMVEIIGEPGVGKTHLASTFPRPFLLDTTPKGESKSIYLKVQGATDKRGSVAEASRFYSHVRTWDDVTRWAEAAMKSPEVATIVVDTGADLQDLARDEYLSRSKRPRTSALQIEYGKIRDIVDVELIFKVTALPPTGAAKNIVLTSQMKNLYKMVQDIDGRVHAVKEGRQVDGFARADFESDIRIYLKLSEENVVKDGVPTGARRWVRYIDVNKNRFIDKASDGWISSIGPDWKEVRKLVRPAPGEVIVE